MNTKTIYALLTIVAIAALAAFLEVQPPKSPSNPLLANKKTDASKSHTSETYRDLDHMLEDIQAFKKDFSVFYDELFNTYQNAVGADLKALGEAVSYAGEIKMVLETIPSILLLEELAKSKKDAGLIAQNWVSRTKAAMDMHLYFVRRLSSSSNIRIQTIEMMDKLAHQLDVCIRLLNNITQVLNVSSGSATGSAQNASN